MNKLKIVVLSAVVVSLIPVTATAQRPRLSPHETTGAVIDGSRVTLTYGRPYSKDSKSGETRKIWGTLVPYGKAWRLGADEATVLLTQHPIAFGETVIPAGAHTLYLVPEESGGKLAISSTLGGWGIPVDEKHDVARVDVKKEALEKPNDQLAVAVERNPSGGGIIKVMWEGSQYSAPFTIKK